MARLLRSALLSLLLFAVAPSAALASSHNVTIVSGSGTSDFTVNSAAGTTTYTANTDDASLGADAITTALASGNVTVNTGTGGSQPGILTVSSALTTASTVTGTLTLSPVADLYVNAAIDIGGQVNLTSPSLLPAANVTSQGSDVNFNGPVLLNGDSTVHAAGNVSMATSVNGAYALTVQTGGQFDVGYTGGSIFPTSLSVTGNTQMDGDTIDVNGPLTFNGNVSRSGAATFYASDFMLGGTLMAGDVTVNPTNVATFEDGSSLGTTGSPLATMTVNGGSSLGNTAVHTTGTQVWNGAVAVTGTAAMTASDVVNFASTLDGPGSLSIDTGSSLLELNGSIGATTALTSLTALGTQTSSFVGGTLAAGSASFAGLDLTGGPSTVGLTVASLTIGTGGIAVPSSSHTLTITGGGSIAGPITGVFTSLTKAGTGTLVLGGTNTYEQPTTVNAGDLRINGSIPGDVALNGGTLSGTGTVSGNVTSTGGTISPGGSPGIISVSGDTTLDSNSTFTVELNGTTAGTDYDQLAEDGQLSLSNAALQVTAADSLPVGVPLTIIDKTSGLDINGTFAGKPEGAVFDVGSVRLKISYTGGGGDNNNVTLTRVTEPTSLSLASGPANATEGSAVTLTATVTGPAGTPAPTGTVTFKDGSTVLGTAPVSGGVATLTTSALAAGDHSLSADFASPFYDASSASASQHIEAKPAPLADTNQNQPPPAGSGTTPTPSPVTIKVADAKGKAGRKASFVTFVVTISNAAAEEVTVKFATKNGSAKGGTDFKAAKGTLTFKPGQTRLVVKVRIVNDKHKQKSERFRLVLSAPVGATLGRGTATGTILDN